MSKLDNVFQSVARALGPVVERQIEILWPRIDAKIDQIVPKILAAIVPALVRTLEAYLPQITDKIVAEIMDRLPQIVEGAVRAVVPDVIENSLPVSKIAEEITKRLGQGMSSWRGMLGL